MAQYDLYRMPNIDGFLLDLQSDLIDGLPTRVVVPLYPMEPGIRPVKRLHPTFQIEGRSYVMATHQVAAVPKAELSSPLTNLRGKYDDITRAIYMLFQGF